MRRRSVRTFCVLEFWKRIVPFRGKQTFGKAFLIQSQCIDFYILDAVAYFSQKFFVDPAVHITYYDVCVGCFSGAEHFHAQIRASDPAADQCGVEHHGLHKSIFGAAQNLIFIRF